MTSRLAAERGGVSASRSAHKLPRRSVLLGGLAGTGALVLSACGEEARSPAPAEPSVTAPGTVTVAPDGAQEITLVVREDYVFYPAAFTVAAGRVRLTLRSEAVQLVHNFRFTPGAGPVHIREEIPVVTPGTSDTVEFLVDQPGDYRYECSFHVNLGQIGTMTVTPG